MPLRLRNTVTRTADTIATSRAADALVNWRAALAIGLAVVAGLALLGWIGGELHYRNCLARAELANPPGYSYAPPNATTGPPVGYLTPTRQADRAEAADACTRVPW